MQKTTLVFLNLLVGLTLSAQLVPTCPPGQLPAENCNQACIYCDINDYHGNTTGYVGTQTVVCGSIYVDNDQWLGFVAGDTLATFMADCIDCVNNNGIQMAIFQNCSEGPLDCDSGIMGGDDRQLLMEDVPLVPGTTYYLLIDGFANDHCSFFLTIDPPAAVIANPIGSSIGPVQGPDTLCPGATVRYSVPAVSNAGAYTWSAPAGWLINGQPAPVTVEAIDGGRSVKITAGNTGGQICVRAANSCFPNGPSICKPIEVAPLPPTELPTAYVCREDRPYVLPWGGNAWNSGTYQKVLLSHLGCDSLVRQQVVIKPALVANIGLQTICSGEPLMVCNTAYSIPGQYTHSCITALGCDSTVSFSLAVLQPVAQIQGNITLSCSATETVLTAVNYLPGTVLQWTDASGQVLGTAPQLQVTASGNYILSARLDGGGISCVQYDTVTVIADTLAPQLAASGGQLDCTHGQVQLSALSGATAPTWQWSGPDSFSSGMQNPVISSAGNYSVTVTDGQNGCTAVSTVQVIRDTISPAVQMSGGTLTCAIQSIQIGALTNAAPVQYTWSGPNGFSSGNNMPFVQIAGLYTVTVTDLDNHCTASGSVVVTADTLVPGATAHITGEISCLTPQIQLIGGPSNTSNHFEWIGPNGFHTTDQHSFCSEAGNYRLVVTGSNGCVSETQVAVSGDTIRPDILAQGNTLSCRSPGVPVSGNSSAPGAGYSWTGPHGFSSIEQNPIVTDTGLYVLTVTAANHCSASATASVSGDFGLPDVSIFTDTITCFQPEVPLIARAVTSGIEYIWAGPSGFNSTLDSVTAVISGNYQLTATGANGCTHVQEIFVPENTQPPDVTATGGTLTCHQDTLFLDGQTGSGFVVWQWSGPLGFSSSTQAPAVDVPGAYGLQVTDPENGCSASATALVLIDTVAPLAWASGGTLTCLNDSLQLTAGADVPVAFLWNAPSGVSFPLPDPVIHLPGPYTLMTISLQNGCTSQVQVEVLQDIVAPDVQAIGGTLNCLQSEVNLLGNSSTPGAQFLWNGPGQFQSSMQNPTVSLEGDYLLTVAGPNGCMSSSTATVIGNTASPLAQINGATTLTCAVLQVTLHGIIETAGATGIWTGPNNYYSSLQDINVSEPGQYQFSVTGSNGCVTQLATVVIRQVDPPVLGGINGAELTCNDTLVVLSGNHAPSVLTQWSGPSGFFSNDPAPAVEVPGEYVLTVTDPSNGCTALASVVVTQDTAAPVIAIFAEALTCLHQTTILQLSSDSTLFGYQWIGPGGFQSDQEDPVASESGYYSVTVTGWNGCTTVQGVQLAEDVDLPVAFTTGDTLTCSEPSGEINCISSTPQATYQWSGPQGFSSAAAATTVWSGGAYSVTITGGNGCTSVLTAAVVTDQEPPVIQATGGVISCIDTTASLTGTGTNATNWHWTGPFGFTATTPLCTTGIPGNYVVTATGANGCSSTSMATVFNDTKGPEVQIPPPEALDCNTSETTVLALVPDNVPCSFHWETGDGTILAGADSDAALVGAAGLYAVRVTDLSNGCSTLAYIEVPIDPAMPSGISYQKNDIGCAGGASGSFTIQGVTGGTPPFEYSLNTQPFTAVPVYSGLGAGQYNLVIRDSKGCLYETGFTIADPGPITLDLGPDTTIHLGDEILLSLDGCISDPDRVASVLVRPEHLFFPCLIRPPHSFQYHVELIDSLGCRVRDSRNVIVDKERWVYIPNIFKPASEFDNLFLIFGGDDVVEVRRVLVFDRWGNIVFERHSVPPNDPATGWDGTVDGVPMAPAVFVYFAEILFFDGEIRIFKGDLTLIR